MEMSHESKWKIYNLLRLLKTSLLMNATMSQCSTVCIVKNVGLKIDLVGVILILNVTNMSKI